ncbi:hypothetical protein CUMW_192100 [Citrus unshiu]|uniref:Uncharacterized protein n=1 Tax=Citrus unshiu TaxID=55188 RepID=A0A2H5Q397_CITUN|nr:hypothetical protein CUMW_192100 [Citrus unshiu]
MGEDFANTAWSIGFNACAGSTLQNVCSKCVHGIRCSVDNCLRLSDSFTVKIRTENKLLSSSTKHEMNTAYLTNFVSTQLHKGWTFPFASLNIQRRS